jgi:NAD(P)-dependent dehydrogenase (short-subunit alcohol dehydrogenase family)
VFSGRYAACRELSWKIAENLMNCLLASRTALVTGSSSGIGLAIAELMEQAGARVIYHAHEPRPASWPADRLFLQADLIPADGPRQLIETAFAQQPQLDLLVSNAGSFFDVPFLSMTAGLWEKTMSLNLRAGYFLIQAFAERLVREKRSGSVVLVASTNGLQAEPDSSAYDTSKGGLVMLTRTLALALAEHGIRVNAIAPGLIQTPLSRDWLASRPGLEAHYKKSIPLKRIGTPQDCAGAAVFLASEAAAYITGHVLVIDGGLTSQQLSPL